MCSLAAFLDSSYLKSAEVTALLYTATEIAGSPQRLGV